MIRDELVSILMKFDNLKVIVNVEFANYDFTEEEPYIDLTIRQEKIFLVIKIINQYSRDFSENLKTTKKKQEFHGIGIRSVKSIVTKYEGEFSIDKKGTEVVVKILIPN